MKAIGPIILSTTLWLTSCFEFIPLSYISPVAATLNRTTFSPDGKEILFGVQGNIYIMDFASRKVRQITTDGGYEPAFSPDGKWIVYLRRPAGVKNDDASTVHRLTGPVFFCTEIWRINVDGSEEKNIYTSSFRCYYPIVSPDGKMIFFSRSLANADVLASGEGGGGYSLFAADADGGGLSRLTPDSSRWIQPFSVVEDQGTWYFWGTFQNALQALRIDPKTRSSSVFALRDNADEIVNGLVNVDSSVGNMQEKTALITPKRGNYMYLYRGLDEQLSGGKAISVDTSEFGSYVPIDFGYSVSSHKFLIGLIVYKFQEYRTQRVFTCDPDGSNVSEIEINLPSQGDTDGTSQQAGPPGLPATRPFR